MERIFIVIGKVLALLPFLSDDDLKPALQCVMVEDGVMAASDGRVLGAFWCPWIKTEKKLLLGFGKDAVKTLKEATRSKARLSYWLAIETDGTPGIAKGRLLCHPDSVMPNGEVGIAIIEASYPDWKSLWPARIPPVGARGTLSLDPKLLEPFTLGVPEGGLALYPGDPSGASGFSEGPVVVLNGKHPDFAGLLAPYQLGGSFWNKAMPMPEFVKKMFEFADSPKEQAKAG